MAVIPAGPASFYLGSHPHYKYIYICSDGVAFLLIKACKCAKNTQRGTKPPVLRKILSQGPDMISHHVQKPEKATTPGTLLYPLFALFLLSLRPIVSMPCFFTCHSRDTWSPLRTSLLIFLFSLLFFYFQDLVFAVMPWSMRSFELLTATTVGMVQDGSLSDRVRYSCAVQDVKHEPRGSVVFPPLSAP